MERKLALSPEQVLERVAWSVSYARDARRRGRVLGRGRDALGPGFLAEVCRAAIARGRGRGQPARHRRVHAPDELAQLLRDVRRLCPELDEVELSVHCHDDLGLAVANSLAGVARRGGAGRVHGERHRRARGQRRARGDRDGAAGSPRGVRRRDRSRRALDQRDLRSRVRAHGIRGAAQQGRRRRERVCARGGHPPGRRPQGRRRPTRSSIRPRSAPR